MTEEERLLVRATDAERRAHKTAQRLQGVVLTALGLTNLCDKLTDAIQTGDTALIMTAAKNLIGLSVETEALVGLTLFDPPFMDVSDEIKHQNMNAEHPEAMNQEYIEKFQNECNMGLRACRKEWDSYCEQYDRMTIRKKKADREIKFVTGSLEEFVKKLGCESTEISTKQAPFSDLQVH